MLMECTLEKSIANRIVEGSYCYSEKIDYICLVIRP